MSIRKVPEKENRGALIAIAGNPNCGKTCIFNSLTGSRQHVGNWPGVTVEKKAGRLIYEGDIIEIVDLPGTYSLGAVSEDEKVARNFVLQEAPDALINVVNASTLERNLYLTVQLIEMGTPVVIALNMIDEAKARKIHIDVEKLSELLGVSIIPTVAIKGVGLKELVTQAVNMVDKEKKEAPSFKVEYGKEIETAIRNIKHELDKIPEIASAYSTRWLAIKLLEGDDELIEWIKLIPGGREIFLKATKSAEHLKKAFGDDVSSVITSKRYEFIKGVTKRTIKKEGPVEGSTTISDKIDAIVTNRFLGIPIFLLAMLCTFVFVFALSDPAVAWLEVQFKNIGEALKGVLMDIGASKLVISFFVDGVIAGLGSVLVFIPPIFLLFLAVAILEDSGYMARVAYIMDNLMSSIGLQGESFIPMVLGLGCNVPGVAATRTMKDKESKLSTILIIPLMSCSARLPVYLLFVEAFFEKNKGLVLFSLYLISFILAVVMGKLFNSIIFKGRVAPLVIELPPYRTPVLKSALINMWERGKEFLQRAGTIIFGAMMLMWMLANLPVGVEYGSQESLIGRLGTAMVPFLKPLGFPKWQAAVALLFGIFAKEIVVGTFGILYGVGESGIAAAIAADWTPLSAYSFMVIVLIYFPCIATIAAIKRETNSLGWTIFAALYPIALGWIVSFIVFRIGTFLGFV